MEKAKYEEFLRKKEETKSYDGFKSKNLNKKLFDFQQSIVKWATRRGRAAIFADTGMGKTFMQVAWADQIVKKTNKQVLIIAPLCVAEQTVEESKKIDIDVSYAREYKKDKILITNYEMAQHFEESIKNNLFSGIVLDESSILKHQDSKTRTFMIELTKNITYKLSCTATPSPNDYMELGSQAEFLGIMSCSEMLTNFFIHDSNNTQKWRLKGHAEDVFWKWLSTWAVYIKKPSDLGFSDEGFDLPELNIEEIKIGGFIDNQFKTLKDIQKAKKKTLISRVKKCADLINKSNDTFIVWCQRNDESTELKKLIPDSVEVKGSDKLEEKKDKIMMFTNKKTRVIITKPKIAGFGLNWQHCNKMAFVGLTDSYEQIYQAIRRSWRFGQKKNVDVFFIVHSIEGRILQNIKRKERQSDEIARNIIKYMGDFQKKEVSKFKKNKIEYIKKIKTGKGWKLYLGDCVDITKQISSGSIDYSIFSPPFTNLYTYSSSERDMGNNRTYSLFWKHFNFFIPELFRVLRYGRVVSVHCMNLPTSKIRDGYVGIIDFRGDIIRAFQKAGFIYHSEAVIWKDPVVAMQRTKARGLLWKQIKKDSAKCRQGIPDYLVTFRKPGENTKPIMHTAVEFPVERWQNYASPCWMDINQTNTLNIKLARESKDERHICPLQLDLIFRAIELWSAEGDVVFSPFAGIGSELFVALQNKRKAIGIELKEQYFNIASENLEFATNIKKLNYRKRLIKPNIINGTYKNNKLDCYFNQTPHESKKENQKDKNLNPKHPLS